MAVVFSRVVVGVGVLCVHRGPWGRKPPSRKKHTTLIALKLQIASNADGSNLTRLCLVGHAKVEIRFRKAGKGDWVARPKIHPPINGILRALASRASSAESRGGDTPKARSGPWQLALRQTRRTAWLRSWNGGHLNPPPQVVVDQSSPVNVWPWALPPPLFAAHACHFSSKTP